MKRPIGAIFVHLGRELKRHVVTLRSQASLAEMIQAHESFVKASVAFFAMSIDRMIPRDNIVVVPPQRHGHVLLRDVLIKHLASRKQGTYNLIGRVVFLIDVESLRWVTETIRGIKKRDGDVFWGIKVAPGSCPRMLPRGLKRIPLGCNPRTQTRHTARDVFGSGGIQQIIGLELAGLFVRGWIGFAASKQRRLIKLIIERGFTAFY